MPIPMAMPMGVVMVKMDAMAANAHDLKLACSHSSAASKHASHSQGPELAATTGWTAASPQMRRRQPGEHITLQSFAEPAP